MGSRIALLSGGKDSLYAAMHHWPPDYGLILVYEFPIPSPHTVNLGVTLETLTLTGIPVIVARLPKGGEKAETVRILEKLDASELIAGDVYIEDHYKYMETIAGEAGARLREPLWGRDPHELLHEIFEKGFKSLVIGAWTQLKDWLGATIDSTNIALFEEQAVKTGLDPLGEHGEYHTLVLESPIHRKPLPKPIAARTEQYGDHWILRLVSTV